MNGTLFEDPYFPANDSSLFFSQKLPFTPEWIRPKVSINVVLFIETVVGSYTLVVL